ncbi:hypothetical protein HT031_002304 [Scenedesmus sp. PABB004]|nr:hypothetical protein HT031_002304 [Scenedesmus sp. PABB004]
MALLSRAQSSVGARVAGPRVAVPAAPRLAVAARASKEPVQMDRATGYVAEDNSGRANIFPTKQQAYINSSTSDAAARQGLGGIQGGLVVGFVIGFVALVTFFGAKGPGPETLQKVASSADGVESLSAIAARIQASL